MYFDFFEYAEIEYFQMKTFDSKFISKNTYTSGDKCFCLYVTTCKELI